MSIAISNLDALMAEAISDCYRRESHLDEQGHMGVPQVMNTNPLHARRLRSAIHFVMQIALRDREQPVVRLDAVLNPDVILNFITQELRQFNGSVALLGLRRRDNVLPLNPLVRLVDGQQVPI